VVTLLHTHPEVERVYIFQIMMILINTPSYYLYSVTTKAFYTLKKRPLLNVDWRKYISPTNETITRYIYKGGDEYLNGILETIKTAQKMNLQSVILIEFADIDAVSVLEKSDYKLALKKLLNLCEVLERYEVCADIVRFEKSLLRKKKRKVNKISTLI